MRVLDRSFFQRTIPTAAARVSNNKDISGCRKTLERIKDMLDKSRLLVVRPDPLPELAKLGRKCLLLRPEVRPDDSSTWSPELRDMDKKGVISVIPYNLHLDYDYWTYHDIITAILPEDEQGEVPSGFVTVGHVAHLNLRDQYLPYRKLIADVLMDKNHGIKTVINKIDNVGDESEFRTFNYEVLAGTEDLNVTVNHENCVFRFNYGKVYWNTRLDTEHRRLVELFKEGDAVCDVMAGVGPFALPAGKRGIFVWANDLNPESYACLVDGIKRNKVNEYVRPFNKDGHAFIRDATHELLNTEHSVPIYAKTSKSAPSPAPLKSAQPIKTLARPKTFGHYVMNLPASAVSFLPSFIGLYASPVTSPSTTYEELFEPYTDRKLPMIHVYTFSTKSDDNVAQGVEIFERISKEVGYEITPQTPETTIWDVRDVAPSKRMFCASFRLPREVAFRSRT
ncbi:hypothetical protein W97_03380 [Coniosporium apollinis CBS 100218]|uniref:tRNA (guanine(37)-N1)-methyltransferase n=1 Tax=Coniosporium apollinis (strain CBS 100218) TaxID=1168221 RepID=R7YQG2_CONA1|nr:uncharacterized protein W97_03380 [Coniosporium apollinis CBS 100218]EON64150.1 hypothetical protein W97_03380 [Coniosporium apollinis CBS 100218]